MSLFGDRITIEVVKGGFILEYPVQAPTKEGQVETWDTDKEVFVSPRKLNQKIKEVIETLSLVKDDEQ